MPALVAGVSSAGEFVEGRDAISAEAFARECAGLDLGRVEPTRVFGGVPFMILVPPVGCSHGL